MMTLKWLKYKLQIETKELEEKQKNRKRTQFCINGSCVLCQWMCIVKCCIRGVCSSWRNEMVKVLESDFIT